MGIFFTIAASIKHPTGIRFLVAFRHPSEKWWSESQLGWWHSQLNAKNNVPNHQQVMDFLMVAHTHTRTQTTNTHFCWTNPTFLLDNLPFTGEHTHTHTHTHFLKVKSHLLWVLYQILWTLPVQSNHLLTKFHIESATWCPKNDFYHWIWPLLGFILLGKPWFLEQHNIYEEIYIEDFSMTKSDYQRFINTFNTPFPFSM